MSSSMRLSSPVPEVLGVAEDTARVGGAPGRHRQRHASRLNFENHETDTMSGGRALAGDE